MRLELAHSIAACSLAVTMATAHVELDVAQFIFGMPVNLGPTVNSSEVDESAITSADGLTWCASGWSLADHLNHDIYVAKRNSTSERFAAPQRLGRRRAFRVSRPGMDKLTI